MSVPELNDRTIAIVQAACRVVAREGTHGLRMEAVAREAGVSKALVHYYFATRRELLRAAFAYVDDRWRARVADELVLAATGADRLERFLLLYVDDEMVPGEHCHQVGRGHAGGRMSRLRGRGAADGVDAELLAECLELSRVHRGPF